MPFIAKLQITPNAYRFARNVTSPRLTMMVRIWKKHDHVDNAVRSAELAVRLAEPVGQHAIFGNAVQHAVGPDDRRVHRAGQNQRAHDDHEHVEHQPQPNGPARFIDQSADQILKIIAGACHRE